MPSPNVSDFVYAALLYSGESPENPPSDSFAEGEPSGDKFVFSFQRPDETDGLTLEVFAFKAGTSAANFSKDSALLSGTKDALKVNGAAIEVVENIALSVRASSTEKGTVGLQIKVPAGCSLTIDDTTQFAITGASPDFTVTQKESDISAGVYPVTFTVKKVDETDNTKEEIVYIFAESINVFPGMHTDTWWNGGESSEIKDVAQSMSTTLYVRGAGGWYAGSAYTATADDENPGTFLAPFKTIQKAVDTIIARNDGTSEYTIYVDGTVTQDEAPSGKGMADFSALTKKLTLTIKALSGTATLDANGKSRVIYASPTSGAFRLTLENLVITGGNTTGNGGGIFSKNTLKMTDCEVIGCEAKNGGGVCVYGGTFSMNGETKITGNTTTSYGGGVYIELNGTFSLNDGTISDNNSSNGGGIYVYNGSFAMSDGTISGNTASSSSAGGVYVYNGRFTMSGGTISGNTASYNGGGVYVGNGKFTMSDGIISNCTAANQGGGVFIDSDGTFNMSGTAKIAGCKTTLAYNSSRGGGIYNCRTLAITDSASIPAGDDGKNDVYLVSGKTMTIAGALSDSTPVPVATITPSAYTENRSLLTAGDGVTITQDICDKFALTPNPDETKWKVGLDGNTGVLKEDTVSPGGEGGISVTLPGQGTYTFKVESGGTEIAEGSTLQSGAIVTFSEVKKDGVALTASDGTFSIEIRDESEITYPNASATGFPCAVTVPVVPPIGMKMQVYVKVVLTSGIVIDKKIAVTGP